MGILFSIHCVGLCQHALHFFFNGLVAPVGGQRRVGCHLRPIKSHYPQLHQTRFSAQAS